MIAVGLEKGYTMALYAIPVMGGVLIEMIYIVKNVRVKHEQDEYGKIR